MTVTAKEKENTTPPAAGNQTAVRQEHLMSLLQNICEPSELKRTTSGKGFLVDNALLHKLNGHGQRKRVKYDERNEKHTKALPFNASVMEKHIDLDDCTYAVVQNDSPFGLALMSKGVMMFTDSAFTLSSRNHEIDPFEDDSDCDFEDESDSDDQKEKPLTTPGIPIGIHETVFEGNRIVLLNQEVGEPQSRMYSAPEAQTRMILFSEGRRNLAPIRALADFLLKALAEAPKKQNFHLYRWQHNCGYWKQVSSEKARPMKSVILPVGFRESVELDMKRFLSKDTRAWYDRRGIPYKRCYMFWGVPGTGKTSLITALAGRFRRNVCFLSAHHPKFTDEALKSALSRVPSRAIVVLEDIDSLFDKDRKTNNNNNPLTFTGLLNAVDGIGEHRGTVFVMTTNFIDRLDSALIRAGRVDMRVEFKHADDYQLAEYFKWFYDDDLEKSEKLCPEWVKACRKQFPDGVTMAELQQHFVDNMHNDAETCIKSLENYDLPLLQRQAKAEEAKRKAEEKKKKEEEEAKKKKADEASKKDDDESVIPAPGWGRRGRGRGRGGYGRGQRRGGRGR